MREEEILAALETAFAGMKPSSPPAGEEALVTSNKPAGASSPCATFGPATRAALDAVPGIEAWDGLRPAERERRERILADIRRRIAEDGPRRVAPDAERGRLFMPFAALTGYEGMIADVEDDVGRG